MPEVYTHIKGLSRWNACNFGWTWSQKRWSQWAKQHIKILTQPIMKRLLITLSVCGRCHCLVGVSQFDLVLRLPIGRDGHLPHRHGHLGTGRPSAAVAIPRASLWCPDFRSAYLDLGSVGIQYRGVGHRPDATAITALLKGKQSIGIRGQSRQMYLTVFHRLATRFIPALKSANSGTVSGQCLFVSFGSAARARISNSVSGAVSSHSSQHSREVLMA